MMKIELLKVNLKICRRIQIKQFFETMKYVFILRKFKGNNEGQLNKDIMMESNIIDLVKFSKFIG